MANTSADGFTRRRCVQCGHEFQMATGWSDTRACPACGTPASRSRDWLLRGVEFGAVAVASFLFWAYWWF